MEIPFTIQIKGSSIDFEKNLFGIKILDEKTGKHEHLKSAKISEDIEMKVGGASFIRESVEAWQDYLYYIIIADRILGLSSNGLTIAEWLWDKAKGTTFQIRFGNKVITTKEDFQKTLDEFMDKEK